MSIKGYKAFNRGMICKGKQYEENTTYEENGNEICEAGVMHFCENPFDVLNYYPLIDENGDISDFAQVEAIGDIYKREDKSATNKLHIGAKLGLKGFIKACVDFTIEKTRIEPAKDNETDSGGYCAKIGSSGNSAQIGSSGNSAQIGSSGDCAQIGSSGDYAQIGSSGDSAKIGSSGYYAKITSEGNNSVVMAAGYNSIVKAKIGSWITLAEWIRTDKANDSGNYIWIPKCVKTEYVDGERIKEDIFYKLVDGEFKEVESED
uniref:DUF7666 domain-containing protein n=1 Tax=Siphoviridae sp. ct7yc1 TaxID=2827788 RepID=A0A8S5TIN6_9CAUD|nr:MAG TPA: hypothetical protein [Siphoviridae sp. ct7yc1]